MRPEEYEEWLKGKVIQFHEAAKKPGLKLEMIHLFSAVCAAYKLALGHFNTVGIPEEISVTAKIRSIKD